MAPPYRSTTTQLASPSSSSQVATRAVHQSPVQARAIEPMPYCLPQITIHNTSSTIATAVTRSFRDFFFQAEDGIRGGTVTGVQTCALPISADVVVRALRRLLRLVHA